MKPRPTTEIVCVFFLQVQKIFLVNYIKYIKKNSNKIKRDLTILKLDKTKKKRRKKQPNETKDGPRMNESID